MADTIIITKLVNGNILVDNDSVQNTFNPDAQCFKVDDSVQIKDKSGSKLVTFNADDVLKVVHDEGTEVPISDVDTLFSELITFFFFKSVGGGSSPNLKHLGEFTNYTDLITQFPTTPIVGTLAYCLNSQGVSWLPGSYGGTFYSKGTYAWTGTVWDSAVDDIAKAIEDINIQINLGLPGVLGKDNKTGANDILIDSGQELKGSGEGALNLRDGADDNVTLKNYVGSVVKSFLRLNGVSFFLQAGNFNIGTHYSNITSGNNFLQWSLFKNPFSTWGRFGLEENDTADKNSFNFPSYPFWASAQNVTIKQGVINVIAGGIDFIVKTSNAIYSNRLILSKNNESFETRIEHQSPTLSDNVWTIPDRSLDTFVGLLDLTVYNSHILNTSNPHSVTKSQIGLGNVPNTDFTSPVSSNTAKISSLKTKSGQETPVSFAGNPKKRTVTFSTPFAGANYSVSVIGQGGDNRTWTIESKLAGSFTINANANQALGDNVLWVATKHGEN
jgi:hypothetical protein